MRRAAAPLAALCLLAVLNGCGGGDGEDRGATTQSASRDDVPETSVRESKGEGQEGPSVGVREGQRAPEGQKAAAPGVPTSKGGDNSIQTWGVEASSAERVRVADLVRRYLNARVGGDWAEACSLLAAKQRAGYARLGEGACARGMDFFTERASARAPKRKAEIEVLSFRIGGGYGFLIYRRPDGKVYATAVEPEASEWKIVSVTPNPIS